MLRRETNRVFNSGCDSMSFFLGAFIIPYCIMSVMAGVPLYILEVSLGQYFAEGPIGTWRIICPLTRGIEICFLH